jgi:hypothetical protein
MPVAFLEENESQGEAEKFFLCSKKVPLIEVQWGKHVG